MRRMLLRLSEEYVSEVVSKCCALRWGLNGPFVASRILNLMRGKTMSREYRVRISEKQRKLIMRALTSTVANNRRSTSGGVLSDAAPDDWMELIGVFAAPNPHMTVADDHPEYCRHRRSCPHIRRA